MTRRRLGSRSPLDHRAAVQIRQEA